jgi:predicted methyltransferase
LSWLHKEKTKRHIYTIRKEQDILKYAKDNPRAIQQQVAVHFITSQEFVFALNDDNMLMILKDLYIDPDIRLIISEFVKT